MLRKAGFAEIAAAVLQNLRKNTGYACYDAVEKDTPSPFLFVEVVGKRDASSKTMFKEIFTVQIHAIATPSDARTEIYSMIQSVEESLTESGRNYTSAANRNRRAVFAAGRNKRISCRDFL